MSGPRSHLSAHFLSIALWRMVAVSSVCHLCLAEVGSPSSGVSYICQEGWLLQGQQRSIVCTSTDVFFHFRGSLPPHLSFYIFLPNLGFPLFKEKLLFCSDWQMEPCLE